MKSALQSVIFLIVLAYSTGFRTCKEIQQSTPNAPSGEYSIWIPGLQISITVFCEMGLNGGGYTFLRPFDLPKLNTAMILNMITDTTNFLLRASRTDGTQSYGVLEQLTGTPQLGVRLNTGYSASTIPLNAAGTLLSTPYLYFGFLTPALAGVPNTIQGLKVNGVPVSFTNCDGGQNSYIALFPDYSERAPTSSSGGQTAFATSFVAALKPVNSRRVMPSSEYFAFMEMHFGGCLACGCGRYTQTGRPELGNILSVSIGFR